MYSAFILKDRNQYKTTERRLQLWMIGLLSIFLFASQGLSLVGQAQAESPAKIIIDEYEIGIDGTIPQGKHTLRVENIGTMLHEVVIFKLKEGTTASDFKSIISSGGSLRKVGKMKGNMPAIKFGEIGQVTATFDAGDYLLLCFQFDKKTGQPHFMIGMLHEFSVT